MRAVRRFEEFLAQGTVKRQSSNRSRAAFLLTESEKSYAHLLASVEKLGVDDDNANTYVKNSYDILMELIRARMLLDGYNASGQGGHEAEVAYLRVLDFPEKDVQFADQLRYFRNGMLYYGTILDAEYAEKVIAYAKRMSAKLREKAVARERRQ